MCVCVHVHTHTHSRNISAFITYSILTHYPPLESIYVVFDSLCHWTIPKGGPLVVCFDHEMNSEITLETATDQDHAMFVYINCALRLTHTHWG